MERPVVYGWRRGGSGAVLVQSMEGCWGSDRVWEVDQ